VAQVGFALIGAGTSVIFPLAMSAAAQLTDRPAPTNVASLAQISFVAFLLGPPLLGYIAERFGIRWSFRRRAAAGHPEHRLRQGAGDETAETRSRVNGHPGEIVRAFVDSHFETLRSALRPATP
jgi:hypothetical protein